jgi:DNA topoisomerase-1
MEKTKPKTTGEICPNCGSELVIRKGRFGEFTACSNYPTCKYIKKEEKEIKVICKCPKCEGNIIEKKTRRGKIFYGCDKYPKCDVALWDQPTGEICPECNSLLVSKKDEIKCSSCEYIK